MLPGKQRRKSHPSLETWAFPARELWIIVYSLGCMRSRSILLLWMSESGP